MGSISTGDPPCDPVQLAVATPVWLGLGPTPQVIGLPIR